MSDLELFLKYNMTNEEMSYNRDKVLLLLHGSYACNLKCIYCENQHLRTAYNNAIISEDLVRDVVSKLGDHLKEITWHGGEPLTLPRSILSALYEEKEKRGHEFIISLQTNSVLLDDETLDFLDSLNVQFGTSFDGIDNSTSRGEASTKAILRCIEEFPNRIGFIGVTYSETIDKMIDNYEYYKSLGVNGIQSCIVRENVIENSNPYLVPNDIAVEKVLEYTDYWIHDTNKPIRDEYLMRHIQRLLGSVHLCEDIDCIGGWLIMDPLGNIGFCGHNLLEDYIVNIKDISCYNDIITHPNYLRTIVKQRSLIQSCQDCIWYKVCYGACLGLNYEQNPSYEEVNTRNCEFTKNLLSGIYELIKDIDMRRRDLYNPLFLEILEENNYINLSDIKAMEVDDGEYSSDKLL